MAQLQSTSATSSHTMDAHAAAPAYEATSPSGSSSASSAELFGGVDPDTLFELGPAPAYTPAANAAQFKPIAVPQVAKGGTSPFLRAWAPEMADMGATREKWLEFIDGLGFAVASSIALAPLHKVSRIASGLPIISSAGTVLSAGIRRSDASLSASAAEKFVSRANTGYFLPRGLQVQLVTGKELRELLALPPLDDTAAGSNSAVNAFETFTKNVRLPVVSPIARGILKAVKPTPSNGAQMSAADRELAECDYATRRLSSVNGAVAHLETNGLPSSTLPSRIGNAWQSYTSRIDLAEAMAKDVSSRHAVSIREVGRGHLSAADWAARYQGAYGRDRAGLKMEERDTKRAYEAEKSFRRHGRPDEDAEREAEREARKDREAADQTFWVVVRPLQQASNARRMTSVPDPSASTSAAASQAVEYPDSKH